MRKFYFKGDMAQAFGQYVELDVSTFREAIDAFDAVLKGFRAFLIRKSLSGVEYQIVAESGENYEQTSLDLLLSFNNYYIIPKPIGAGGALGFLGGMAGNFLMGYGMEWFVDQLNPVTETGEEYEIIETNSYIYSSNENIVQQGTPVPIVYGVLRVGSLVVGSSVNNYDYNYDNATIYNFPVNLPEFNINLQKVQGGNYSFINGQELTNLRNQAGVNLGDQIRPYNAGDSTLRQVRYTSKAGAKAYSDDLGNNSYNSNYQSEGSKGGQRYTYGPSVSNASSYGGGSTNVGTSEGYRPFLFPSVGHKDYEMRPASSDTPCGKRSYMDDGELVNVNISYIGGGANSFMKVKDRGNYQKLESIGIYKSLDILCEGPIAGLANPITGYEQDIHTTSYGYNGNLTLDLVANATTSITIGDLNYNNLVNHIVSNQNPQLISGIVTLGLDGVGSIENLGNAPIERATIEQDLPDNVRLLAPLQIISNGRQVDDNGEIPEGLTNDDPLSPEFGQLLEPAGNYVNTPSGVYAIMANGMTDDAANIYIRPDKPTNVGDADIGETAFTEPPFFAFNSQVINPNQATVIEAQIAAFQVMLVTTTDAFQRTVFQTQIAALQAALGPLRAQSEGFIASDNAHIFLYRVQDGAILVNNNSTEQIAAVINNQTLGDVYSSQLVDANGAPLSYNLPDRQDVNGLPILELNLTQLTADTVELGSTFNTGGGYGTEDLTYTITPRNGIAPINDEFVEHSITNSYLRKNRATFVDGSVAREFSSIQVRTLETLYNGQAGDGTIPNDGRAWSNMCRIQIDNADNFNYNNANMLVRIGRHIGGNQNGQAVFLQMTASEYLACATITLTNNRIVWGDGTQYNGNLNILLAGGNGCNPTNYLQTEIFTNLQYEEFAADYDPNIDTNEDSFIEDNSSGLPGALYTTAPINDDYGDCIGSNPAGGNSFERAIMEGRTINIGGLIAHGETTNIGGGRFSDRAAAVFLALNPNAQMCTIDNADGVAIQFPKFVPGSGSNTNTGTRVIPNPDPMNIQHEFFNTHMLEGGNNNLDSVITVNDGSIEYTDYNGDTVRADYGSYCPMLSPRIVVYTIRKYRQPNGFGSEDSFAICRTNIDALGIVDARGRVVGAYLHTVPDLCVLDEQASGVGAGGGMWTALAPQDINMMHPFFIPGAQFGDEGNDNTVASSQYLYQDIAIILECHASNGGQTMKFDVANNGGIGSISDAFENDEALEAELHGFFDSWSDHVQFALPFPSSQVAEGVVPSNWTLGRWGQGVPVKNIDVVSSMIGGASAGPTTIATAQVPLETLNINNGRDSAYRVVSAWGDGFGLTIGNPNDPNTAIPELVTTTSSLVCTGRPIPGTQMLDVGAGYPIGLGSQVSVDFHNVSYYPSVINYSGDRNNFNSGYKPNSDFLMFGIPRSVLTTNTYAKPAGVFGQNPPLGAYAGLGINFLFEYLCMFASTIVNVKIDGEGSIEQMIPIDSGYGYSSPEDPIVWLLTNVAYDSAEANGHNQVGTVLGDTWNSQEEFRASGAILNDLNLPRLNQNSTNNWLPELHFPKEDFEVTVRQQSLNADTGSIGAFHISNPGLGFTPGQLIDNIFSSAFIENPLIFIARFSNRILRELYIDLSSPAFGYSGLDSEIDVSVSPAPRGTTGGGTLTVNNDPVNDLFAVYRSIYLNDVPIRDTNDRFNFSRFHFDMKLGNFRNGRNNQQLTQNNGDGTISVAENQITDTARGRMLDDEFKVPSNTKFINYPLTGPRNHGEKDYFYSYTIKNSEVTDICISIKINKLHYIYEGDEEVINLNLVPILGAIIGFYVGKWLAGLLIKLAFPDPVFACGCICVGGATAGQPSTIPELAVAALIGALVLAGGIAGAIGGLMLAKRFKCKYAPFLCFKIGDIIKNSGEIWPAKVRLAIEYGVEGQALNQEYIEFAGCATNPYVKDVYINNLPMPTDWSNNRNDHKANRIFRIYRTTREMDPVTGGLVEARYQIDCELLSITEYVCGFFNYPNTAIIGTRINSKDMPSIPRREFLVKGKLIRIPSNYSPAGVNFDERYPGGWNGEFQESLAFSSNPAWVIWDLLTNKRYGAGKYGITENDLDKWSFYEFAQYCDQDLEVYIDGVATTERRHMCNLYIDSTRNAYEYIQDLLKTYDASLNFTAGKFYFIADRSDLVPIMLFNNSNVTEEGFSYSSTPKTQRITACTVDYVDERDNYIPKSEYVEDNEGVDKYGYSHIRVTGFGVTRKGEAYRLAWQKILSKQIEKELIQFQTGLQGSYLKVGDVINVIDNNKLTKYSGGKITKAQVRTDRTVTPDPNGGADIITTTQFLQLTLDIPSEILRNVDSIKIQTFRESEDFNDIESENEIDNRSTVQFNRYRVFNFNGFNVDVVRINTTNDNDMPGWNPNNANIDAGFTWIVDENIEDKIKAKQYRIKSIKELDNLQYQIIGIDYVAEKYEQTNRLTADIINQTYEDISSSDLYHGPEITGVFQPQNPDVRGA